ncbi:hypothetical protein BaRGS_00022327 [Batillaria attramentaria]|uniref:Uncharacterized protein n=1 Tax=Batillaria attramentaria TaxID=370345 RepID=A0ABD0KGT0_9CAEN
MHRLTASLAAIFLALLVVASSSHANPVPEPNSRVKRQWADVITADFLARMSLGDMGCVEVGCGLVDPMTSDSGVNESSRNKRQSADVKTAEYLAWIALGGRVPSQGCFDVACGVVDVFQSLRVRRSSSDQRMAELQALMALTGSGGRVAHGQFDPLRMYHVTVEVLLKSRRSYKGACLTASEPCLFLMMSYCGCLDDVIPSRRPVSAPSPHAKPGGFGKKKRDFNDEQRYQLLRAMIERAAAEQSLNQ